MGLDLLFFLLNEEYTKLSGCGKENEWKEFWEEGTGIKKYTVWKFQKINSLFFLINWKDVKKVSKETETRVPRPQGHQQYSKCLGVDSGAEECKILPEADRNTEAHGDH